MVILVFLWDSIKIECICEHILKYMFGTCLYLFEMTETSFLLFLVQIMGCYVVFQTGEKNKGMCNFKKIDLGLKKGLFPHRGS